MSTEDQIEIRFRLYDGTDIGPTSYSPSTTIQALEERLVLEWPQGKKLVPKTASDLKLINAGKILENGKTLGESRVPMGDLPGGIITMHVVIQPPLLKKRHDKNPEDMPKKTCAAVQSCSIILRKSRIVFIIFI